MFSLRIFIKKGLLDAIGQMADYQVILNAAGWQQKGVLLDEDLAEIDAAINEKNTPKPEPVPEVPEVPEDAPTVIPEVQPDTPEETPSLVPENF